MAGRTSNYVAAYFGAQVRKEREKAGLNISALSRITGINDAHLGRIEKGIRPPTAEIAAKMDEAFPRREGWFTEFYEESRSWVPPAFRIWSEHEDPARYLWIWSPGIMHGLVQTADYARRILMRQPDVTDEIVAGRLKSRLDRQQRILYRTDPPRCVFIVDLLSLYRQVGTPEIMADQLARLIEAAQMPRVTVQVMPAIDHGSNESAYIITEEAAYAENAVQGGVYQDRALEDLTGKFEALRAECWSAPESLNIIKALEAVWRRGENPLTAAATGVTA